MSSWRQSALLFLLMWTCPLPVKAMPRLQSFSRHAHAPVASAYSCPCALLHYTCDMKVMQANLNRSFVVLHLVLKKLTVRLVSCTHCRLLLISCVVSPNLFIFFSATSTAFSISSTCNDTFRCASALSYPPLCLMAAEGTLLAKIAVCNLSVLEVCAC